MADPTGPVRRGLRRLRRFDGRDAPRDFWPYAGAVLGVSFVLVNGIGAVAFVIVLASTDVGAVDDAAVPPGWWPIVVLSAVALVANVVLLASAVTRRLHDRGRRGGWALVPLALVVAGAVVWIGLTRSIGDDPDQGPGLFLVGFAINVLYFVALGVLVIQLILRGDAAENRYGPPPLGAR